MLRELTYLAAIAMAASIFGCQQKTQFADAQVLVNNKVNQDMTIQDIKSKYPASEWLETQFSDVKFTYCIVDIPAYGSSKTAIYGWVFRDKLNVWESLFNVHLNGVGKVNLSIDSKTGLFSAKGGANNKFLNKDVFVFDLNATEN